MRRDARIDILLIAALAAVSAGGLAWALDAGAGISPDSTIYVSTARNVLDGRGFITWSATGDDRPLTHFPPGYPALLAAAARIGGTTPMTAGKWLNVALLAASATISTGMIYAATRSRWAMLTAGVLIAGGTSVLRVHGHLWSEPPFVLLSLATMAMLSLAATRPSAAWIMAAGAAAGLATGVRYVGATWIIAGAVFLLSVLAVRPPRRARWTAAFVAVAAAVPVAWAMRNLQLAGGASDYSVGFHPIGLRHWRQLAEALSDWLVPGKMGVWSRWVRLGAVFAGAVLVGSGLWRARRTARTRKIAPDESAMRKLPQIAGLFAAVYFPALVVSISFLAGNIPLNLRMLAPLYVPGVIGATIALHRHWRQARPSRRLRIAVCGVCLLLAATQIYAAGRWMHHVHQSGRGFGARGWRESPTLSAVRDLPEQAVIYSNAPDAIYILTDRRALAPPVKTSKTTGRAATLLQQNLRAMRRRLGESGGFVVWFNRVTWRDYYPSERELVNGLGLVAAERHDDGAVYRLVRESDGDGGESPRSSRGSTPAAAR